jgi:dipeptidyl aminopeptidase/acylaminoacyl peptidase
VAVFVRGHDPNDAEWVANPSHFPDGAEQAIWAVRTGEGKPFRLTAGRQPVLSPDGKTVVFISKGQVHGVPVPARGEKPAPGRDEDAAPLFRTWGTNSIPSWSPDGRRIAFVSDRRDHSFIGVYELAGRKITYLAPSVDRDTNPAWSGDGKKIAFVRRPGSAFGQITASAQAPAGRPAAPPQIAAGQTPPPEIASSPGFQTAKFADGHTVTFWTADVESGRAEMVWREPIDDAAYRSLRNFTLVWAGDSLVFPLERENWPHTYMVPVAGGLDAVPVDLTPGAGETEFVGFAADGKTLYYTSNVGDIDRRHLWKAPTAGGPAVQLTSGDGIETAPAPLASGESVAVLRGGPRNPQGVALVPAAGGEARLVRPNVPADFPLEDQVVPESVVLKAEDGLEFHNQVFVPKSIAAGERRPAILFAHGGPQRQMLLGYHYMFFYHMAYAVNQYLAGQGYVVISVNYRSGIGYGRDFRMAPERGAAGSSEYRDILAAAKYLQARPDVDPDRIGLWGLSYGGLITALGLSRNSDIFKVGVDIAGVHLWGNSLDVNATSFKASSVATVDKWTSPVLLVHGDDDRNVAFSQTTGLVQLLRARQVPHELIVFPDEVHDFLVFGKWLGVFRAADDFLGKILWKK